MRIKCIAVENYKLTEGKIYNAESESRDFYKLLNDHNIGVRYNKRLFELAEEGEIEQVARPARAVVPPPPPPLTERDLVESIRFLDGSVTFTNFDRTVKTVNNRFTRNDSSISCGVTQISGINSQIQLIDSFFEDDDDYLTIRKALFTKCIEQYVRIDKLRGYIFGTLSTNTSGTDDGHIADEDMLSVLDELADTTTISRLNPNSDRNIKVWVMSPAA